MNNKKLAGTILTFLIGAGLWACGGSAPVAQSQPPRHDWGGSEAAQLRLTKGKALFEEKCRTVAGEKIYRRIPDVEGIVLLKIRPRAGDREFADQLWAGAAFALEWSAHEYIQSFMAYEYAPGYLGRPQGVITPQNRGYINTERRPDGLPGYQFVETIDEKSGERQGYRLVQRVRPNSQIGYVETILDRVPPTTPSPRYGVTFEDHVIPDERILGFASSTVKILDLETQEVLGELTRYAWSLGGASSANPSPWLTAHRCPPIGVGADTVSRKFVDQVLIPRKGK